MSLELEDYLLTEESLTQIKPKVWSKQKRRRTSKKSGFLRGPIPCDWLSVAAHLPGKSLHVGLAIWLAYGVLKEPTFQFSYKWLEWSGVAPGARRESLHRLRDAGLIVLEQQRGRLPIVTLLDVQEGSGDE